MHKYLFKPYEEIYSKLYEIEASHIKDSLLSLEFKIEIDHIGSTAIEGLGGKGIVDILITAEDKFLEKISYELSKIGYIFSKSGGDVNRLFHHKKEDYEEFGERIFHIHVTYFNSADQKEILAFRDYLKENPKEVQQYSKIKEEASENAVKYSDMKKAREVYTSLKGPFIREVLQKVSI